MEMSVEVKNGHSEVKTVELNRDWVVYVRAECRSPAILGKQPGVIGQTTRRYWANNQALLGKQPGNIGQTTSFFAQNGSACNSAIIQYQSGSLSFVKALPGS
jgi:hypothetical protein